MRTISITEGAYNFLKVMRLTYHTFGKSLTALINELLQLRKENAKLKRELKQKDKVIINALNTAISNKSTIQYVNVENSAIRTPPPPPGSLKSIKPLSEYNPKEGTVEWEYQMEVTKILNGTVLKPSEVLQQTEPKFHNQPLKQLSETFTIPHISTISIANKTPKPCKI